MTEASAEIATADDSTRQVDAFDMLHFIGKKGKMEILDLGAGDGRSFDVVTKLNPEANWIGLDIEESGEVRRRKRTDCTFVSYNGVDIPFEDARFDVIFSRQVFEHVRYPERVMAEVYRVLRPGGFFVGSVSQLEPLHSRSYWNFTHFGFSTIAQDAGLILQEMRPGIDGLSLIFRNLMRSGLKLRNPILEKYFENSSPLNLFIDSIFEPDKLSAQDRAEIDFLVDLISGSEKFRSLFPDLAKIGPSSPKKIRNLKLRYAGHICFNFMRPE